MARLDYFGIEQELAAILRANLNDVTVEVEKEMLFSPEQTPWIGVYLDRRDAPRELQRISAGTRTQFRLTFSIWVWCFGLGEKAAAIRERDNMIGEIELILMKHRTINDMVDGSWTTGGRLPSGRIQSATPIASQTDWLAGGETILIAEAFSAND